MKLFGRFIFAVTIATSCFGLQSHAQNSGFTSEDRKATISLAQLVKDELERTLPDFSSSRIRNVIGSYVPQRDTEKKFYIICGSINSKNAFGGYSGWQDFFIIQNDLPLSVMIGPRASAMCSLNQNTVQDAGQDLSKYVMPSEANVR